MSLVEVLLACLVASIFTLGVLRALIPALDLSQKDYELSRAHSFCQNLLEEAADQCHESDGFNSLASTSLAFLGEDNYYCYRRDVVPLETGLKRASVVVYYAVPGQASPVVDVTRGRDGLIVQSSLVLCAP
ncbi:MAG: hypothetical protein AB1758_10280 [Candidatus Eremiobacterota bacterium]